MPDPVHFGPLATALAKARATGGTVDAPAPLSVVDGYRVAEAVQARLSEPAGWKVGATNAGAQAFLGTGEPIRGRMFRDGILLSPASLAIAGERPCEVEPEIVLEVGADGRAARAFLGVEINRPSHDDALTLGAGFIVADNAAHVALVLGPELPIGLLDNPVAIDVTIIDDAGATSSGNAAAVLDDPRRALAWLANVVALRPGELVATGAMCRAVPIAPGGRVVARFGALGDVEVRWPVSSEVMGRHRL